MKGRSISIVSLFALKNTFHRRLSRGATGLCTYRIVERNSANKLIVLAGELLVQTPGLCIFEKFEDVNRLKSPLVKVPSLP